jgi:hypothetical protein
LTRKNCERKKQLYILKWISAEKGGYMTLADTDMSGVQGGMMGGITGYAQPLRAIGQALEVLNMQDFEVEPVGDEFYVRGNLPSATNRALLGRGCTAEELRAIWGAMPGEDSESADRQTRNNLSLLSSRVELCYSAQDVERLDETGRSRRGRVQVAADAYSLSQILRSIGAYLNQKRARLSKLSREVDSVVVEYESSMGSRMKETLAIRDLYDLWVRMYLHRAERTH